MALEKTELRSAAINEVGNRLDDVLEASKAEMHRAEGGIKAAQKALERALQLTALVDKDLDNGSLDIERAKLVKNYLVRVQSAMRDLVLSEEKLRNMAQGMVLGMERAVKETRVMFDRETAKLEQTPGDTTLAAQRSVVRPGMTIKQQRLAEDSPKEPIAVPPSEEKKPKARAAKKKTTKKATKKATKKTAEPTPARILKAVESA